MAGGDLEASPKLDGLIQSSTTSILLASTPPMLPRWSLTDSSGRPLLADCQRSNSSKALKTSQVSQDDSRVKSPQQRHKAHSLTITFLSRIHPDSLIVLTATPPPPTKLPRMGCLPVLSNDVHHNGIRRKPGSQHYVIRDCLSLKPVGPF